MRLPAPRRAQGIGKWKTIKKSWVIGMSEPISDEPSRINDRTTLARINDQEIYHITESILSRCEVVSALLQFLPTVNTDSVSAMFSALQPTLMSPGRELFRQMPTASNGDDDLLIFFVAA